MISGGVFDSWLYQKGQKPEPRISTLSRTKSLGRLARSVAIITHRPVTGSFLNSDNFHSSFAVLTGCQTECCHPLIRENPRVVRSSGARFPFMRENFGSDDRRSQKLAEETGNDNDYVARPGPPFIHPFCHRHQRPANFAEA